ncbi:Outer membrane protein TolC [Desulfopila aestuarii DSM 18488]|uniref:Outer membrane protein TolC n=2 Tax=Desulfopila aestuarii TaxID=231440 RepID=A0A1M7Y8N2_9BACT|nr:Outer membrane protein TolC [Desulfopila aestuarii DSM 18488]
MLAFLLPATPYIAFSETQPLSLEIPGEWSLAQAVEYALTNNPEIHIALERIASSQAMATAALSATLPTVTLGSEYSQTDNPMYSFGNILNQGAFDNSIDFNDPGRTDSLALQAMLQYRLYDGGKTRAEIEQADATKRAAESRLGAVHHQLAYEVVRSYYNIRQAEEMVDVRNAAVASIEASLAVGRARYEEGDLLKEDILNLELQQARERENSIRSRHDFDLACKIFWNLLGLHSQGKGTLPEIVEQQEVPEQFTHAARKELEVIRDQISAAEAALSGARSTEKPVIDSYARYQYEYGTVLGESGDSWQAGVRLNYSLYNGNRTEAEISAAQARLAEMQAMQAKIDLALDLEMQQAEINYMQTLERLQLTAKMVEVAEESAKLSRTRFQEGVILASDLIDTEMRLTDARARRASAKAENRIAIANLRRATGAGQF